jgi:hypothetical protein
VRQGHRGLRILSEGKAFEAGIIDRCLLVKQHVNEDKYCGVVQHATFELSFSSSPSSLHSTIIRFN